MVEDDKISGQYHSRTLQSEVSIAEDNPEHKYVYNHIGREPFEFIEYEILSLQWKQGLNLWDEFVLCEHLKMKRDDGSDIGDIVVKQRRDLVLTIKDGCILRDKFAIKQENDSHDEYSRECRNDAQIPRDKRDTEKRTYESDDGFYVHEVIVTESFQSIRCFVYLIDGFSGVIVRVPSKRELCDYGKYIFLEVFSHIERSGSLYDTSIPMEHPEEERYDAIEKQIEHEVMPEIRTTPLESIEDLTKYVRLGKHNYVCHHKKYDSEYERYSLFLGKVPALCEEINVGVFHKNVTERKKQRNRNVFELSVYA